MKQKKHMPNWDQFRVYFEVTFDATTGICPFQTRAKGTEIMPEKTSRNDI